MGGVFICRELSSRGVAPFRMKVKERVETYFWAFMVVLERNLPLPLPLLF
jgi:hypothetical protein